MAEKLILGIDPGTQVMGYALLAVEERPRLVLMDVLYLKNLPDMHLRLRKIFDATRRIIDSYHPDHLAVEAPFMGKNVQSMIKLGRAQGVAIAAAMSRDMPYTEYEPSVIKQTVTGNGNASKMQVANVLRAIMMFPDSPRYLDATDALAVAWTAYQVESNPMADLRSELMPKRKAKAKSKAKAWAEFVEQNPDRTL